MGRAKNKKANNPPQSQQQSQQPIPPVAVDTPLSTTTPALADLVHDEADDPIPLIDDDPLPDETPVIPPLQPYLSLLPALRGVGQATQQALHDALFTAGSTAAQALESYLKDKSLLNQMEGAPVEGAEATSESEELRLLLNYVSVEMAADNLKRACSGPDGKILLRDADGKILNEVAAAALSAFAYAASRRPSTKHVEYLMNPTQSVDAHEDTGSQSSQTLSALADPKLQVAGSLPTAPYQRCSNASTGTNGSAGMGNPFGVPKARKRSTQRRLHDADDEALLSEDEEDDDLDEDDVSDVDLDEDSEPLTDLLDESRRTDSPLDDFDNTDALLRFACTVGHVDIVKSLVKIRNSPDYICIRKSTMLMEACCAGQREIVRELLTAGADINAESESRNTPLIYASTAGKLECVQELLKHSQIQVDARNTSGHTALMESSSAGHLDIVKELLSHGANIYAIVENVDFKESSLSLASYRGHVDVVRCLLDNMQDCAEKVDELHTGLLEAAMDGHVEVARVLLDGGALVNLPTENFESPLTLAACGGHYDLVKLLLDRHADIEEPNDESYTPLMEAAREGHKEVVELLLDRGANVNSKIEEGIETPLTLAASGGYLSVVELLVSRGGNLLLGERSPLYEATQEGHVEVADYIVKQLKKVDKPSDVLEDLNCALVCAAETNNMTLVNLFLESGANKDCYSKDGRTPMMEAARQGHVNMLEFLLQCGADINKISPNGDATALSLACLFGHSDAVQFLLENGANPEVSLKDSVSCIIEASRNGNTDCARIVLDYIGLKSKQRQEAGHTPQQPQIPISTAAEISNRPKIKPVSKLNKDPNAVANSIASANPYPLQFNAGPPVFPQLNGDASALAQEFSLLGQKLPPDLAAAAAASLKAGVMPNGAFGVPAKQDEKSKKSAAAVNASLNKLIAQQQQSAEDSKLNELLQQLPGDLVNAMLAATATTNAAQTTTADESSLAHFLQRALVEPKRRDAAWTNEELSAFKEMVRQKVRQLPAATPAVPSPIDDQQQQQQHDLMMANMLAECCPGCTHNSSNYVANALRGLQPADALNAAQIAASSLASAASLKRKGVPLKPRAGSVSAECGGSFGSRQVNSVKQKLAETSELLRSKLDAIQLTNEADETLQELQKLSSQQQQQQLLQHLQAKQQQMMVPNQNSSVIQTSMYLNRINPNNTTTTLTPEQQQQILFYQQQEIHNLQNLQTAAGHHHVGSTAPALNAGPVGCHQAHHNFNSQMNCLSQLHHGNARMARRTGQAIGPQPSGTASKLCSGKHMDRRTGNPSSSAPPPNVSDSKVSSYVDMQTEANNDTALTVACVGGHAPLVGLLIQRGASVEHRDKKGFTPLILAATGGHVDCCKLLLDAGCQVDAVSERTKDTALSLACSSGRKEVVELLLRFNANKEHRNVSDYTPLSLAASGGYVDIIHLLLDAGAEINSRTGSKLGISPLMLAAMNGHDQATLLLLERGSDINAQIETNRNTALTLACFQGRTEVVRLLLDYNANYEHRAKTGLTPLMEAANGGFTDVGALLLKSGADPNAPPVPTSRDTALTIAADKGHSAFVSMLLIEGAAIDVKNKKGCTPLFLACSNGHLETVRILVANQADVDALDNRKTSPLVAAFRKGFVKAVEFMVQHVNQFPNDQECQRFCTTIQDPDLSMKANKCLKSIMDAKTKQAEQANLAAKLLLDQLDEEKALAESKKLSKKRLKEKKKAKKLAKKQMESEEATIDEPSPEPEEQIEVRVPTPPPEPKKETNKQSKKQKKGTAKEVVVKEQVQVPLKEETPEVIENPPAEDTRVPIVHDLPPSALAHENGSSAYESTAQSTNHSKVGQRRQNRGRRSEQTGNGTRISIHPNTTIVSPQHSPNVAAQTTASIKSVFNEESEWCSAGKKHASSRPGKESSITSTTNSSSSRDIYHDLVTLMNENNQVTDAWTLIEPNGKRRAFAVNVNSGTVARIIGRAGQNINAIREATNAHIEVEKIATRREQSTRQITVKGSHDAIRSAIQMIDLLIRENDTHVSEIIYRVISGESSTTSPITVPGAIPIASLSLDKPSQRSSSTTSGVPPAAFASFASPAQTAAARPSSAAAAAAATNVWQQRAAIRKLQQSTDDPQHSQGGQRAASSSLSASTSASVSPVPVHFVGLPSAVTTAPMMATTTLSQHDYVFAHSHVEPMHAEDLKRKAPGFERPSQSLQATPVKPSGGIERSEESSAFLSGLSLANDNPSTFVQPLSSSQPSANTFLSSMLTDNSSVLPSFSDSPPVPPAPLSHLAVGSQRHLTNNNNPALALQRTPRPISEIWSNSPSSGSGQVPAALDAFGGGLFGAIDSKSSLTSFGDTSSLVNPAPLSHLVVGSQRLTANNNFASGLQQRPLSEIWSSAPTTTSSQVPAALDTFGGGLFGAIETKSQSQEQPPVVTGSPISTKNWRPTPSAGAANWSSGAKMDVPSGGAANWSSGGGANKVDVFSLLAAQVGDVAEKEKRQQTQAQQAVSNAPNSSINNVYAAYNATPQIQRMQHNRVGQNQTPPIDIAYTTPPRMHHARMVQNMTPPIVPTSYIGGVTWSGQPNPLNNNPKSSVFNNKVPLNPNGAPPSLGPHQSQQPQWNGWNY